MTATEAKTAAREAQDEYDLLVERLREIAPSPTSRAPGSPPVPLEFAEGPEHEEAMRSGTPEEILELEREFETKRVEALQLARRREALQERARIASEAEARREAPSRLRETLDGFSERLDRLEEARRELAEAEGAVRSARAAIGKLRELVGAGAPGLRPVEVRRLWMLTAADGEGELDAVGGAAGSSGVRPRFRKDARELLADPPERLIRSALSGWRPSNPQLGEHERERARRRVLKLIQEARVVEIINGDLQGFDGESTVETATELGRSRKSRNRVLQ